MIGPVLWLRRIQERFGFRHVRKVYIKLATKANGHPNQQKIMPNLSLRSHALSLTLKAFEPFETQKQTETRSKVNRWKWQTVISKRLRRGNQPIPHTHKRPYKKNFFAYIGVGAVWNGNPKWDGPCKWRRLPAALPFPQGMTVGWPICLSAKAADQQILRRKRKLPSQTNFNFRWFDSYNMRKTSKKSTPIFLFCSYTLLSPWSCKTLEPFEKQSWTETK